MTFLDLMLHYKGSVRQASVALGVAPSTIYGWKRNGIDHRNQKLIEYATGGKLKCTAEIKSTPRTVLNGADTGA